MTLSLVAYVPAAFLADAHKLMWALGFQEQNGQSFSVLLGNEGGELWGCHSAVAVVPATLPPGIDWPAYGLTEQSAQAALDAIVSNAATDAPDWGLQRFLATIQGDGLGLAWVQPIEATTAYRIDAARWHQTVEYFSRRDFNVTEPGTFDSGWQPTGPGPHPWFYLGNEGWLGPAAVTNGGTTYDLADGVTDFREPGSVGAVWVARVSGPEAWAAGTNYLTGGEERTHNGETWLNRRVNNTQQLQPGTTGSGWLQISNLPAPWYNLGNEGYPATLDGSAMRVIHNYNNTGLKIWRNDTNGNTWEPGVALWVDEGPAP